MPQPKIKAIIIEDQANKSILDPNEKIVALEKLDPDVDFSNHKWNTEADLLIIRKSLILSNPNLYNILRETGKELLFQEDEHQQLQYQLEQQELAFPSHLPTDMRMSQESALPLRCIQDDIL